MLERGSEENPRRGGLPVNFEDWEDEEIGSLLTILINADVDLEEYKRGQDIFDECLDEYYRRQEEREQ